MRETRQAVTRLTLDLALPDVQKSVSMTKGDVNRRFEITLTSGGAPFPLPAKWSVILAGVKPDGSTLCNSCVVDGGKILYDFAAGHEIATCAGCFSVTFIIYDEVGDPLYTPELWLHVAEDEGMELASASQATTVEDMLRRVKAMETSVEGCEAEVLRMDEVIRTSLKGDKGDKGDRGEPGVPGPEGPQGVQGERGEPFAVAKVYPSVAAMEAGYATDGVSIGAFVVIDTGNADDEENARVYMKGMAAYEYLTDLSGARGMQGPQGVQGLQGVAGKTAYQYAVEGGFAGSEADWRAQLLRSLEVGAAKESVDSEVSAVKNVPATAAPYAKVLEIGGMTYKEGNTLRSAAVTEVESVGVNLLAYPYKNTTKTVNGVTYTDNGDGSVSFSGTPTAYSDFSLYTMSRVAKGAYYLSLLGNYQNIDVYVVFLGSGDTTISEKNYRTSGIVNVSDYPETTRIVFSLKRRDNGVACSGTMRIMLNEGTTALPYTPYTRHTLPIPEAVRNLDGYGWGVSESVYNYIDWEKKQFVKRCASITITEVYDDTGTTYDNIKYYSIPKPINSKDYNKYTTNMLIANYKIAGGNWNSETNIGTVSGVASTQRYWFGFPLGTTIDEAKAVLVGKEYCYNLAEPVITDISDLLPADNYIGVEGGGTVTMVSEYGYDVPSKAMFYEGSSRAIGSSAFVGDLTGVAARAEADGEGRRISDTYVTRAELEARLAALEASLAAAQST